MGFYDDMQDVATELITEFGQSLTFIREAEGAYDPATGTTPLTSSTFTGIGVEVAYKKREVDGERVLQTDKKLICNAMATPPVVGDKVTVGSNNYKVLDIVTKTPAGTVLVYELQVRL